MWIYVQSSEELFSGSTYVETGYSGALPDRKNKPDMERVRNVGPIPRGYYSIGAASSSPTAITPSLTPGDPSYCSPPRSGLLIHGDNSTGTASQGCIVLRRATRQKITESNDMRLRVVRNSIRVNSIKRRSYAEQVLLA